LFSYIIQEGLICEVSSSHTVNQTYFAILNKGSVGRKSLWRKKLWWKFLVEYFL